MESAPNFIENDHQGVVEGAALLEGPEAAVLDDLSQESSDIEAMLQELKGYL